MKWNFTFDCCDEQKYKTEIEVKEIIWNSQVINCLPWSNHCRKCSLNYFHVILAPAYLLLEHPNSPTASSCQSLMFDTLDIHNDQTQATKFIAKTNKHQIKLIMEIPPMWNHKQNKPIDRNRFCATNDHNLECDKDIVKCVYHRDKQDNSIGKYSLRTATI